MVQYRTFHNSDPPSILKLWHASNLGPSAAEGFPCDILELFVFSLPYFDPNGFFLAVDGDRVVGFAHAAFPPNEDQSGLDRTSGGISAIVVHPEYRRQGIGRELVKRIEQYLTSHKAASVSMGCGLDSNGFYNGIYGGSQASGFSTQSASWSEFATACGYQPESRTDILHRDLTIGRDPISARLIRHRRRLSLQITDRFGESWWWYARFGELDALSFVLCERHTEELVASGRIMGLDVFVPKWGVRAVGIYDVLVPEDKRRSGYGTSLILEICRRLREQSIQLIEAHVDSENEAAMSVFNACNFEKVGELVTFTRNL